MANAFKITARSFTIFVGRIVTNIGIFNTNSNNNNIDMILFIYPIYIVTQQSENT